MCVFVLDRTEGTEQLSTPYTWSREGVMERGRVREREGSDGEG